MTDKHLSDTKFSALGLHPDLIKGINEAGFEYCTPIQALTLPLALKGEDVAGQAQTGTGKTAAFLLAAMNRLILENELEHDEAEEKTQVATDEGEDESDAKAPKSGKKKDLKAIRTLILAPTRELAIQIHKDAQELAKHTDLKLGLAYGGTGYESQKATIEAGVDILIGTPGRVIDYFKQGVFHLKNISVVVMDEADRMFDLGFITDIRYLLRKMPDPKSRLNLLFSATLSFRVDELAYEHMNAPQAVKVKSEMVVKRIEEVVYFPAQNEKISLLINLLKQGEGDRALVFINTKREAAKIFDWLEVNGIKAAILSGDVQQSQREKLLKKFHDGEIDILVATDVAARGLHIPDVSHVYNYDLPQEAEDYVHRSGRTGRAGASGIAISFACEKYAYSMTDIEKFIGHALPVKAIDDDLLIAPENKPAFKSRSYNDKPRRGDNRDGNRNDRNSPTHVQTKAHTNTHTKAYQETPDNEQSKANFKPRESSRESSEEHYTPLDKPIVKPALVPEDISDSKFIPPPGDGSIRFGEIPAIG